MENLIATAARAHERACSFALAQWRAESQVNWRQDLLDEANARRAALCEYPVPCAAHFSRNRLYERAYQDSLRGVWA